MPNHIQNKLKFSGNENRIKQLVEAFSTFYPSVESKTHNGEFILNKGEEYGWLNPETNVFSKRIDGKITELPELEQGFEKTYESEWTRFPDFEKIVPVPEVIKAVGDSVSDNIETAVKAKYNAPLSDNGLLASLEYGNRRKVQLREGEEEQFKLACKAYEETGFAYWYDWNCANWGTKWNCYQCEKISDSEFLFQTAWSSVPDLIKLIHHQFKDIRIDYAYADEYSGSNAGRWIFEKGLAYSSIPESQSKEAYDIYFELHPDSIENYKLVGDKYEYIDED